MGPGRPTAVDVSRKEANVMREIPMLRQLALVGGLAVALAAGTAVAQTPFGGDDAGFIPPNKDIAKCENSVAKNVGKAAACILSCHKKRANGVLADETAEDECETT